VKLVESHIELPDGGHDDVGKKRCAIGIEQPVEGTPNGIVREGGHLLRRQAEALWSEAADHLVLAVDRLTFHQNGAKESTERLAVGHADPAVPGRYEAIEAGVEIQAADEAVDERERAEPFPVDVQIGGEERLTRLHLAIILTQDMEIVNHDR